MSNYPEGHDPNAQRDPGSQGQGAVYGEARPVLPPPPSDQPASGQFAGHGPGSSGNHMPRVSVSLRSALTTTEFWVFVVVSIALLIAAAVSDSDRALEGQGFGPQEAWKYVTALAVAFILSRGLTKFGGRDEETRHDHDQSR